MRLFQTDENQVERIDGMTNEYPYCMHTTDLTDFVVPWHWHQEVELGYIKEGASIITTVGAEYTVHQGDGFFINSNVMDTKRTITPGTHTIEINHIFHPVFLSGHFKSRFETRYIDPVIQNRQIEVYLFRRGQAEANRILNNLYRLTETQQTPENEFLTRNILSETWMLMIKDIREHFQPAHTVSSERQNRIRYMIAFIHTHYMEKINTADIAAAAGISDREALRTFRNDMHQSPIEYLNAYRLDQAKHLLLETESTITEISGLCGFSDSAYFTKQFHKAFGVSPRNYRPCRRAQRGGLSLPCR